MASPLRENKAVYCLSPYRCPRPVPGVSAASFLRSELQRYSCHRSDTSSASVATAINEEAIVEEIMSLGEFGFVLR